MHVPAAVVTETRSILYRFNLATRLAVVVLAILAVTAGGYVALHNELAAVRRSLELNVDASQSMLRAAYEMEILVAEIAADIRRGADLPVAPPASDPRLRRADFERRLADYEALVKDAGARELATMVRTRFDDYVVQVLQTSDTLARLAVALDELGRTVDGVEQAIDVESVSGAERAAAAGEALLDVIGAARYFVLVGGEPDSTRFERAFAMFMTAAAPSEAVAPAAALALLDHLRSRIADTARLRQRLNADLGNTNGQRDELRSLIHGRLQQVAATQLRSARDDLDLRLRATAERLTAMLLLAGLLGFSGTFAVARGVVRPIQRLAAALRKAGEGRLTMRVPVDGSEEIKDVAVAFNDMAERLQTLTVSRAVLDDILRSISDGVLVIDDTLAVSRCNEAAAKLLGLEAGTVAGLSLDRFIPVLAGDFPRRANRADNFECELLDVDGKARPILLTVAPLHDQSVHTANFVCTITDITRRKQDEVALVESREALRNAYISLQQVQEDERKTIARDVHDEFGALLTVMNSTLFLLQEALSGARGGDANELLAQMQTLVVQASDEVDRIVDGLYPPMLDHFGLVPALESYVQTFEQRAELSVALTSRVDERLAGTVELAAFRIVQESLTNIAKHARARTATIDVRTHDGWLVLTVADDGAGASAGTIGSPERHGLRGLNERVVALGGELNVEAMSSRGGVSVCARIPLDTNRTG